MCKRLCKHLFHQNIDIVTYVVIFTNSLEGNKMLQKRIFASTIQSLMCFRLYIKKRKFKKEIENKIKRCMNNITIFRPTYLYCYYSKLK